MTNHDPHRPTVIKVGGSVLRETSDYLAVAGHLRPWVDRDAWVVVSAAYGVTDELERLAAERRQSLATRLLTLHERLAGEPLPEDLAAELRSAVRDPSVPSEAILSWGERASACVLRTHLSRLGMELPIVELTSQGHLPSRRSAIVPGFYLRDESGRARLLPRGGSDISAVLLATRLQAREVRFWKDGGGLRSADGTATLSEVDGIDLLARLNGGIRPLHPAALQLAMGTGVDLVLEDPSERFPSTRIRGAMSLEARPIPSPSLAHGPLEADPLLRWGRR